MRVMVAAAAVLAAGHERHADTILAQRLGLKAGSPTKTARARAIKLIEQERQAAVKLYLKAKAKASEAKRAA